MAERLGAEAVDALCATHNFSLFSMVSRDAHRVMTAWSDNRSERYRCGVHAGEGWGTFDFDPQAAERKERYVVILDALRSVNLTTDHRLQMAAWLKQNREPLRAYCQGAVFVIENKFVKGLLQAILLFAPMPYPLKVAGTLTEALIWSQASVGAKKTA